MYTIAIVINPVITRIKSSSRINYCEITQKLTDLASRLMGEERNKRNQWQRTINIYVVRFVCLIPTSWWELVTEKSTMNMEKYIIQIAQSSKCFPVLNHVQNYLPSVLLQLFVEILWLKTHVCFNT